MLIFEETYEMHLAQFQARESQQTSRKSSARRLDNLPMAVGLERVRKDMLERRRARLEQMAYIGTDMRSKSAAQSRANKTMFEQTLSLGGRERESVVRAALRKCMPTSSRVTGPSFYGSPLYNKRTRLMASIRARSSGWPPAPMFRGRVIAFDADPMAKSPLEPSPATHPMPNTVTVALPVRRNASLRPIATKYPVAMPAEDVEPEEEEVVQPDSPTAVSAHSSRTETVVSNTVIAGAGEETAVPVETDLAVPEGTTKLETESETGKQSTKVSVKSPRGRGKAQVRVSPRGKDAAKETEESTAKESAIQSRSKLDSVSVNESTDDDEEPPMFVHWVDTVTVSSVCGDDDDNYSVVAEDTGSTLLDIGGESERDSKLLSLDLPNGMLGEELQPSVPGVPLDRQQTEVDDRVVVEAVTPLDLDSDQQDGRECVLFELPDFVCPSSEEKSKEVLVKEWLCRCNMAYAKRSLPLL